MTDDHPEVRAARTIAVATVTAAIVAALASIVVAWMTARGAVRQEAPKAVEDELKRSATEISRLSSQTTTLEKNLSVSRQDAELLKGELERQRSELYDRPAVLYRMRLESPPKLKGKGLHAINFNQKIYDTHTAVKEEPSWRFQAPKDGIYTVTAYLAFAQAIPTLEMALHKQSGDVQSVNRFIALIRRYPGDNTMVGGSAPIVLRQGDNCSLVVNSDADEDIVIATPGTTWIWIRYEQPIPASWQNE